MVTTKNKFILISVIFAVIVFFAFISLPSQVDAAQDSQLRPGNAFPIEFLKRGRVLIDFSSNQAAVQFGKKFQNYLDEKLLDYVNYDTRVMNTVRNTIAISNAFKTSKNFDDATLRDCAPVKKIKKRYDAKSFDYPQKGNDAELDNIRFERTGVCVQTKEGNIVKVGIKNIGGKEMVLWGNLTLQKKPTPKKTPTQSPTPSPTPTLTPTPTPTATPSPSPTPTLTPTPTPTATPPAGEPSCTDSDGGMDFFTKGTLTMTYNGVPYNLSDECNSATTVTENFCTGPNGRGGALFVCPSSCYDGACRRN